MKILSFSVAFVAIASAISLATVFVTGKSPTGNVDLSKPNSTIDVGFINDWEIKNFVLSVQNPYDFDVRLNSVTPSCGCTTIASFVDHIAAKNTAQIPFKLHFGFKKGEQKISSSILINSSSGNNKVTLSGVVKPSLSVTPLRITKETLAVRKTRDDIAETITIKDIAGMPIESVSVQPTTPALRCKIIRGVENDSNTFQVEVGVSSDTLAEMHSVSDQLDVIIRRSAGDVELRIPVEISSSSDVLFEPEKINLGIIKNEQDTITGEVRLSSMTAKSEFEVIGATCLVPSVQLNWKALSPGVYLMQYQIHVADMVGDVIKVPIDLTVNAGDVHHARLNIIGARMSALQCCNQAQSK